VTNIDGISWLVLAPTRLEGSISGGTAFFGSVHNLRSTRAASVVEILKSLQGHWRSFSGRVFEVDKDGGIKHRV
jgi:hypothetical protein